MANPLTHALDIATFALWLSVGAAGAVGILIRESPPSASLRTGVKSGPAGPVFLIGETRAGKLAKERPAPPSRSAAGLLPAPPEMPAIAATAGLPDVPDFPARAGAGPAGSVAARLAAGDTPGPVYPPYSLRDGQSGTAVVQFTVDAAGRVRDVSIYSSSGWNLLDREALRTVLSWRYPPGETMKLIRPVVFKLP